MSPQPVEPEAERLLKHYGTAAAVHAGGRSLRDHLIGTFNLLKEWGNDRDVCLAGLFHSIYGTEVYTLQSAQLSERDTIRGAIGARAEELAYYFCVCDRNNMLSNVDQADAFSFHDRVADRQVPLDCGTLTALVEIAFANSLEQLPYHPGLQKSGEVEWAKQWARCTAFLSTGAREALQRRMTAASTAA
jgi:hypothetical protein